MFTTLTYRDGSEFHILLTEVCALGSEACAGEYFISLKNGKTLTVPLEAVEKVKQDLVTYTGQVFLDESFGLADDDLEDFEDDDVSEK